MRDEQRAGRLPDDLDAAQLVLSEVCLTMGPFLLPQLTQLVTGKSVKDPEFLAEREEFLARSAEESDGDGCSGAASGQGLRARLRSDLQSRA